MAGKFSFELLPVIYPSNQAIDQAFLKQNKAVACEPKHAGKKQTTTAKSLRITKREMHRLAQLDRRYVWHPFTQMQDWLKSEPVVIVEGPARS